MGNIKLLIQIILNKFGYKLMKVKSKFPIEFNDSNKKIFKYIKENDLSMTSNERLFSTIFACKYVADNQIEGDFVECGVWRGGNSLLAASVFSDHKLNKKIYMFDTFAGMTEPTDEDKTLESGEYALANYKRKIKKMHNDWCFASVDEVENNFKKINLMSKNIIFVKGDILTTLKSAEVPEKISVLRLDTDWYESTKFELEILYPKLVSGGVLIIDDYGHWSGSKKATDEYFDALSQRPYFHYIDYSGRVAIKP